LDELSGRAVSCGILLFMGRAGEESFRTLFEPPRRSITLHCYRMLGSLQPELFPLFGLSVPEPLRG